MQIKVWRDPYDAGFNTTTPREITLETGLTVLVGCNGAGKTTLLNNIKEHCKSNEIPCHMYNNIKDGGTSSFHQVVSGCGDLPCDNMQLALSIWNASEGEAIKLNIGRQSTLYKKFMDKGIFENRTYRLSNSFRNNKENTSIETNIRVLLFDATDSGLSIDNICDIKSLFNLIKQDAEEKGIELYIIISANEYELCNGEQCFDVNKGKYITFNTYDEYKRFILKSRNAKEKRIVKQIKWQEKQKAKELEQYNKLKAQITTEIDAIKAKADTKELSHRDRYRINDLNNKLRNFVRYSRFLSDIKEEQ